MIANGTTTLTIVYGVAKQLPGRIVTQLASCPATSVDAADFNNGGGIDIAVGCDNAASWVQQQATGDTPTFQVKGPFGNGIVGRRWLPNADSPGPLITAATAPW